jgi:hypothetical protein
MLELDYDAHLLKESPKYHSLDETACATTDGTACILPFNYKGVSLNGCTKADHTEWWCATHVDAGGSATSFGTCADACPKVCESTSDSDGGVKSCIFPFHYHGVSYQVCTAVDGANVDWCPTSLDSSNTTTRASGEWGKCNTESCHHETCATTDQTPCVFPFKYKTVSMHGCTKEDHTHYWCATATNANGEASAFGNCIDSCPKQMPTTTTTTTTNANAEDGNSSGSTNSSTDVTENRTVPGGTDAQSWNISNHTNVVSNGAGTHHQSHGMVNRTDAVNGSGSVVHSKTTGDNSDQAKSDADDDSDGDDAAKEGSRRTVVDSSTKSSAHRSKHEERASRSENSSWSDSEHVNKTDRWNETFYADDEDLLQVSSSRRYVVVGKTGGGSSATKKAASDKSWLAWMFGKP